MIRRRLGRTGLLVAPVGFGGAAIGIDGYLSGERRDDVAERSRIALRTAIDAGVNLFDAAPVYGGGRAERLLGEVTEPVRDRILLATKLPFRPDAGPAAWAESLDGSLERLRTGYVDLLQLHGLAWTDDVADRVLASGVLDWLHEQRAAGRVRFTGLTAEAASGALERLIRTDRFDVLQMAYSVIYQGTCDFQRAPFGPIPLAKSLDMGIMTMRTATSGVLQKLLRLEFPDLDPERVTRLALRFVLSTPQVDCALIGMRTPEEVAANVALASDPAARIDVAALHDFFDGRERPHAPT